MAMRHLVPSASIFSIALFALTGCGPFGLINPFKAEETRSKTFRVKATPEVVVNTFNGKIDVSVGSESEVQAEVVKSASGSTKQAAEDDLLNIEVAMIQEGNKIQIVAKSVDQKLMTNRAARVELQVPPGTVLNLHTSNGSVTAFGPTGAVSVDTSNGPIEVRESQGVLNLGTSNGAIVVEGGADRLDLHTSNGAIRIQSDDVAVAAHSSNGAIEFEGTLADGKHSFETSNGRIRVSLPADASFDVTADTSNGKISCDFQLKHTEAGRKTHLRGTVGGDPKIDLSLHTSNGSIEILKAE